VKEGSSLKLALKSIVGSFQLKRFARRQQLYIAIAVAIYAGLWAAGRSAGIGVTLIYTLSLCNFIACIQDYLSFLYQRQRPVVLWTIYVGVLMVISVAGVAVVNVILYPSGRVPGQTLGEFLRSGWKFPFMATMIVGVSTQFYRRMRERLEIRNRELEVKVELVAAASQRHEQELEQAREIQQSLLPKHIPQLPGFEIDGAWEPARVVGGDYFDVIQLSTTKLGICIADVVGKSISAALLMANVQASVRAFATNSASPSALCSRVNSVLCTSISTGKFVTFFYGVLDAEQGIFEYTNAGHPPPILLRARGEVQELTNGGAVLGVFPDWTYRDSQLQFQPGDRLLLFTDGITEAAQAEGEEFGEQRLIQGARNSVRKSTAELKASLLAEVKQFCSFQLQDDATLIVLSALPELDHGTNQALEVNHEVSLWER
jgi:sigma-B regulation protein RsbU (phosphoserine phosphatase)